MLFTYLVRLEEIVLCWKPCPICIFRYELDANFDSVSVDALFTYD
jgi:hypothetical protein